MRKRSSAHFDLAVGASTPKGRSPARKRPLITLTQTSPLTSHRQARKSLNFHPKEHQASLQVSVVSDIIMILRSIASELGSNSLRKISLDPTLVLLKD